MVQKCNRQMAAVLMVLSLGLPGSAEAEVFWEDGFELPATWSNPSCGVDNPILAPTSAFKRTGTKSMQEYFTGHPPNYEAGALATLIGHSLLQTPCIAVGGCT